MSSQTRYIFQHYPEKKAQIWRLLLKYPKFRSLCSDYGKCIEAKKYWDQSKDPKAKIKAEDYRYLSKALEKELLQALEDNFEPQDNGHN